MDKSELKVGDRVRIKTTNGVEFDAIISTVHKVLPMVKIQYTKRDCLIGTQTWKYIRPENILYRHEK